MKKNIFKFSVLTLAVLSLTACTLVPGQNLSTSNKDVIELPDNQYDLDKMVNIYPVTPGLIDQLRAKPIMSQANPELEQQIANYELSYRHWGCVDGYGLGSPGTNHPRRAIP